MEKLVILMALALAMSTAALANPVFQDRGAEASNPLYEGKANGGGDCDDTERCLRPDEVSLTVQTRNFSDTDSDGDGLLTLKSTEVIDTNQGQIVSAIKSERPKFKAGAELSKTARDNEPTSPKLLCLCSYDYLGVGDLDGDGFADVMISADTNEETLTVAGTEISKKDARKGFIKTENSMNKAELIEAMASHAGLSKADSKKALEGVVGEIILGEDRDMVMPGDSSAKEVPLAKADSKKAIDSVNDALKKEDRISKEKKLKNNVAKNQKTFNNLEVRGRARI